MERRWNEIDGGGGTCPSATLSTTNPTWTGPGSNPGLRGGRLAANRPSHGTAQPLDLDLSFGAAYAMEKGYAIWTTKKTQT
jgi:hypothetical protein